MNYVEFSDVSLRNEALTVLDLDASPAYRAEGLRIYSDDIFALIEVLNDNGIFMFDCPARDRDEEHDPFHGRDAEADADALASAGMGTDEDYGGGCEHLGDE